MMAILSGAWWAQKLTGATAKAVALAVSVAVILAVVVGSLWWLRHDARMDERAHGAVARVQDAAKLRARERKSEAIGADAAQEWAAKASAAEAARVELETKLAAMKTNPVCWPRGIVGDLNR